MSEQSAEKDALLTQSERRTYQSLLARGYSQEDALSDALDGVDVHDVRRDFPPGCGHGHLTAEAQRECDEWAATCVFPPE